MAGKDAWFVPFTGERVRRTRKNNGGRERDFSARWLRRKKKPHRGKGVPNGERGDNTIDWRPGEVTSS